MRTVVERQGHRLGREIVAEYFVAFRPASAHLARWLFGQGVAELRQDLVAIELLAQGGDVRVPLLARGRRAASRELREDARHLFAVRELDDL